MQIVRRHLNINLPPGRSAFLWGPRKVGKSYWLQHSFRTEGDRVIDLLETDSFAEYAARPALLRERWDGRRTIIDEVQKVPALLDVVHWLIAHRQASFLLTGSSARKLRREHANLLAGRAWRYGFRLPAWTRTTTRRMIRAEKFYLFDVGVANHLARRRPKLGSTEFGKSFEHWVLMELLNYRRYREPDLDLRYWRTSTGMEVDFILGEMLAAVEVKASERVAEGQLGGLRALSEGHTPRRRVVVSLEREPRRLARGIDVLPWQRFLEELWSGELTRDP